MNSFCQGLAATGTLFLNEHPSVMGVTITTVQSELYNVSLPGIYIKLHIAIHCQYLQSRRVATCM